MILFINICWNLWLVLKPKLERREFERPLRGHSDVSVSENYYCIKSFCRLNTLKYHFEKVNNGTQKSEEFEGFKTPAPERRLISLGGNVHRILLQNEPMFTLN